MSNPKKRKLSLSSSSSTTATSSKYFKLRNDTRIRVDTTVDNNGSVERVQVKEWDTYLLMWVPVKQEDDENEENHGTIITPSRHFSDLPVEIIQHIFCFSPKIALDPQSDYSISTHFYKSTIHSDMIICKNVHLDLYLANIMDRRLLLLYRFARSVILHSMSELSIPAFVLGQSQSLTPNLQYCKVVYENEDDNISTFLQSEFIRTRLNTISVECRSMSVVASLGQFPKLNRIYFDCKNLKDHYAALTTLKQMSVTTCLNLNRLCFHNISLSKDQTVDLFKWNRAKSLSFYDFSMDGSYVICLKGLEENPRLRRIIFDFFTVSYASFYQLPDVEIARLQNCPQVKVFGGAITFSQAQFAKFAENQNLRKLTLFYPALLDPTPLKNMSALRVLKITPNAFATQDLLAKIWDFNQIERLTYVAGKKTGMNTILCQLLAIAKLPTTLKVTVE